MIFFILLGKIVFCQSMVQVGSIYEEENLEVENIVGLSFEVRIEPVRHISGIQLIPV